MPLTKHLPHQMTIAYRVSYLLGATLLGLHYSLGFAGACLAQEPAPLPQPPSPENVQPANEEPQEGQPPAAQPVPTETVPVPTETFGREDIPPRTYEPPVYNGRESTGFRTYRLDIGDAVSITVIDFPEFSFSGQIDNDGNVFVPILGKVPIVGLTIQEVETKIAYELGRTYLKTEPQVVANLAGARPVQLTLLGEVVRPGFYTLPAGTSVISLLLSAGGTTPKADLRSIIVRRPLLDGTVLEERVDLYTPLLKGEKVPDLQIQGGDTIVVSKLEFGQDQGYDRGLIARTNLIQQSITVRILAPTGNNSGVALRNLTVPSGSTFLDVVASLPTADTLRVNLDEVALLRFDPEKGRVVSQSLSPEGAIEGDFAQDVPLQDQDVIVVSRTLLGEVLSIFSTITQPVRDVFGFSNTIFSLPNRIGF